MKRFVALMLFLSVLLVSCTTSKPSPHQADASASDAGVACDSGDCE
jgi:hypothetical protein